MIEYDHEAQMPFVLLRDNDAAALGTTAAIAAREVTRRVERRKSHVPFA